MVPRLSYCQEPLSIVPYPKEVTLTSEYHTLEPGSSVGFSSDDLAQAAALLVNDFKALFNLKISANKGKGTINLSIDKSLAEETYHLQVAAHSIDLVGGSYHAVVTGMTSLLQMSKIVGSHIEIPAVQIKDYPKVAYRGFLLDVARQWHNIATVKQVVDLCRWYKIRYMQFHLTDDQSFTFPSTAFPKLASSDRHYTKAELVDLVNYAEQRGVTIIPEFDAPGHTQAMRRAMPELFGESDLGVINMADKRVYTAMETLMEEMMAVFHTSPYFHIGADEAWLGEFEKREETIAYVKEMGFDNAHDIYLDFMVKMHEIVKKNKRQTLIWESFDGDGSAKVKIPKDIIVFAWETAYQRPESLLKNGYTLINASWKPTYVTPGFRWNPDYIYQWNLHRWENHWNVTPAYQSPIQLNPNIPIMGGQMCSWEMSEEQQIPSIHQRIPAISEVLWNGEDKQSYTDYRKRYLNTDAQFSRLIFPVQIEKEGFTYPNYEGIYYNKENTFGDKAVVRFQPMVPETTLTYTTDGSMPTLSSPGLPSSLDLTDDFVAKIGVFNASGERIGYKLVNYELAPIKPAVKGTTLALRDTITTRPKTEFLGAVDLSFVNLKEGAELRYTTDGKRPTIVSSRYIQPIVINQTQEVKAQAFYQENPVGKMYASQFVKKNYKKTATTGAKVVHVEGLNAYKAIDGFVDLENFWDSSGKSPYFTVDLQKEHELSTVELFTYWDGSRYYQYTVELSSDGTLWEKVIDRTDNTTAATKDGYVDKFTPQKARFIRVHMIKNSANPSVHIVELRAY